MTNIDEVQMTGNPVTARKVARLSKQIQAMEDFAKKISEAKPLLMNGKTEEFIMSVYGKIPEYLWYKAPQSDDWHPDELAFLWDGPGGKMKSGDIEIPNRMRIRDAKVLRSELLLAGETLNLELIGHTGMLGGYDDLENLVLFIESVKWAESTPYPGFNTQLAELRAELAQLLA